MHLILAVVVTTAVIGFVVGIDDGVPRPEIAPPPPATVDVSGEVIPATGYAQMRATAAGPNRDWKSDLSRLPRTARDAVPAEPPSLQLKEAALAARAQRRAFNGAPPVVPHMIEQTSSASCLACHRESIRVGETSSAVMPHPYLTNCLQCHVAGDTPNLPSTMSVANAFTGLAAPTGGERAWDGAPPLVPHSTFMRDECLACHGPTGPAGLRTTHPERSSCLQCHAPSARLDQAVVAGGPRFITGTRP